MGRPTKPRVKGNMQPASSSRAADLAGTANSLSFENLGGFAQFVGASSTTAGIASSRPATPSSLDGFESSTSSSTDLDPELVVILKKVTKRDAVTKLKALEELENYLKSNKHAVGHILHNWVPMYGKLVLEVDRRVRLVANQVHSLITANAKKRLAPLLKEFIGPWILAMNDQSKDVARVAQCSFEAVFAQEKRLGVMTFCQKEILDYVTDMLLYKTADTLSDARYVSKEDMAAKYARIISSSFAVISYLITALSLDERTKCQNEYDLIMDDTTMWKRFATHENPVIRKALYTFIRTLLLNWKEMIETRLDLICPNFYASVFTEKDTSTHSDMWDALLLMTKKFPSSWVIIGKKKPALPKLYHFLRSGLNGSVSISYPSMLALLANLPDELKEAPKFYTDVFENFWKGLSTDFIDRSNSHIFLNAYAECVVYFAITLSKSADEKAIKTATDLIENTFWDMIKVYFLNSRDKNIGDKLDPNGYAIVAKHLVVMASVESVKDCMVTFWSHMDALLVQTVIDCGSEVTRAPLDMDVFCQKTGNLLTAISREIQQANNHEKYATLQSYANDLAKRLLLASLQSSIVHKDKAFGLLVLAYQLISNYRESAIKTEGVVHATQQLLVLFTEAAENAGVSLISFYVTLVAAIKDKDEAKSLWSGLMNQLYIMFNTDDMKLRGAKILLLVLEQIQSEKLTLDFDYNSEQLDSLVETCALVRLNEACVIVPRPILESIVSLSLSHYLSFKLLSDATATGIISGLEANLVAFNRHQYIEKKSHALPEPSVQTLKTTLSTLVILQQLFDENADQLIQMTENIICEVFDAMFVTAKTQHEEEEQAKAEDNEELSLQICTRASAVWDLLVKNLSVGNVTLLRRIKRSIIDIRYSASPSDSVRRIEKLLDTAYSDDLAREEAITAILGTEQEWKELSEVPLGQYTNELLSLGIVNNYASLAVQPLIEDSGELTPVSFDIYGLSAFGRFALFLGEYLSDSHVRKHFFCDMRRDWVIGQLMMTSAACEQGLTVPGICRVWESKAVDGIRAFVQSTDALFSDWLVTSLDTHVSIKNASEWNERLLKAIKEGPGGMDGSDRLLNFVARLMKSSENEVLSATVLQHVLQRLSILIEWSVEDLEKWLPFVKAESNELDLLAKIAILSSFKNTISSTNTYKHYQSDLASKLSGVSKLEKFDYDMEDPDLKKKTNYSLLALLNASSLKYGSFDIPRQRIMYLIQGIRPMLQNDDDDYEFSSDQQKARVQAQLAQLLKHLADTVQDISGSHREFFLQSCFGWVACADASQPEELIVVYSALDLFNALYTLSQNNDELLEVVHDHLPIMSKALLELMAKEEEYLQQKKDDVHFVGYSKARLVYQTLLAELLENIPEKTLIESECFNNLNALIHTPNEVLQKRAYLLLQKYVAHRVQDLSVRLEFTETNEEETRADIDKDVFDVLLNPPDLSNWQSTGLEEQALHEILGYLLTWMLMFDHFTDITFKLKQEYTAQLKEREAVSHLMPVLCKVLSVGQGHQGSKPFDLTPWSIVEYDTEGFDSAAEMSYLILASHLYYRALTHIPSLIRLWWIDCKQRQLTIAVESYTEKYFSQQLINNEMDLVNRPDIKTQLEENEENEFTVKTLRSASEVTATYRVDEQNMQIAIKLPSNFPLRQIDVEGVQKVGVNDKQWRGWMFAVAAVIGSQNGNIVDALTVFKRNVNLHFSGVEDCTICYSIISVQDRSIPTKQCRTCKNKFHSSCLYKWFRSSNSASCPLCRTVF
ncbi:uncharacterized protein EV154DRAFT_515547 [Mucor mucedo]|uniref:uncharacterized protein n=1 Tax=Mucor mucedo TaxID=29922 RepID=UPI0022211FF0|nr:uncharacterized protein EV154DRAFT_515547 [Mucor mucedo]KAI7889142.1 hypothetical protein EV154DRAFT_515547 [Mucor mucedo]